MALGGSVVLVSEAAVSAVLVVTIQPPGSGLSAARFLDSLLGGVIALAITSLLPTNPVLAARRAAALPLVQIAGTLEDIARALERADPNLAERKLDCARAVERDAFEQAVAAGRETLHLAPFTRATLSVSAIVLQVRSAAVDLLRGSGVPREEAERLVREAARSLA